MASLPVHRLPTYDECSQDELALMKAELERLRTEKHEEKKEKKNKEEMEKKKEKEKEDKEWTKKLREEMNNTLKRLVGYGGVPTESTRMIINLLEQLDTRETMLKVCGMGDDWPGLIITTKGIWSIRGKLVFGSYTRQWEKILACPLYRFHEMPNLKRLYAFFHPSDTCGGVFQSGGGEIIGWYGKYTFTYDPYNQTFGGERPTHAAEFEAVMRLTPGEYRNGGWRPVCGFFGPYVHDETGELSMLAPELVEE